MPAGEHGPAIEGEILGGAPRSDTVVIRAPRPGDMGWVVQRHAAIYVREQGRGPEFEALVAQVCADFLDHRDDPGQAGWIAEGRRTPGAAACSASATTAGRRSCGCCWSSPGRAGAGWSARLVEESAWRFAADAGYTRIQLWTRDVLTSAQRIYPGGRVRGHRDRAGRRVRGRDLGAGYFRLYR